MTATDATNAPAPAHEVDLDLRGVKQKHPVVRWLGGSGTWVLLLNIALIALFTLLSRDNVFFSSQNFRSVALAVSTGLLLALAVGLLLSAGVIDLSVGSNLVLSSVVGAMVIRDVVGPVTAGGGRSGNVLLACLLGLLTCMAVGALFGLVNGLIIEFLDVNSFIATLGTLGIGTGITLLLTNGADISQLPIELQDRFSFRTFLGVPLPAVVALLVAAALWAALRYLRFGVRTLSIGSSRVAAERAGIRVRQHILLLVALAGALAGLAGFFSLANFGSTTIAGHNNDALNAITAAVIGGTALMGGRINVLGIIWGAILAILLQAGLVVIGVQPFYQLMAVGVVLIFAVALDRWNTKRRGAG
ncbi:ABC transporter permease [Trujillonella humicola]|uniref:ABC transporter permease n=1 Tax=Trujillonella humicola TaxID=3383699 RepID=UPI003905BC4B